MMPQSSPVESSPVATPYTSSQKQKHARLRKMNLTELAAHFGTDKAEGHHYTAHYERHLGHLRDEHFNMLEIGVGQNRGRLKAGASLRMWKWFFRRAEIIAIDIKDMSHVARPRIHVFQGDQSDASVLRQVDEACGPFTVIIDDGSHRPEHIRASFATLFPLLEDGGIYAIEDTQTSYWPEFGGSEDPNDPMTSMALVKSLVDGLNYEEYVDETYVPSYTDLNVVAVHCYHNLVFIEKGSNIEGTNRRKVLRERYAQSPT